MKAKTVKIIRVNEGGTNSTDIILAVFIDNSLVKIFDENSNYSSGQIATW
jgi:hypothetical protein